MKTLLFFLSCLPILCFGQYDSDETKLVDGKLYTNNYFSPQLITGEVCYKSSTSRGGYCCWKKEIYKYGVLQLVQEYFSGDVCGNIKMIENYTNGQRDGETIEYHKNGQKSYYGRYRNGVLNGEETIWYDNGRVMAKGSYKNGQKHGVWLSYLKSGSLDSKLNYVYGNLKGEQLYYNSDGSIQGRYNY
jgi:antitoxin component YwqK of YwqJK toxin-antitoxin module